MNWKLVALAIGLYLLLAVAVVSGPCNKPLAEAPAWCLMLFAK